MQHLDLAFNVLHFNSCNKEQFRCHGRIIMKCAKEADGILGWSSTTTTRIHRQLIQTDSAER
jgi:hypothetical protein